MIRSIFTAAFQSFVCLFLFVHRIESKAVPLTENNFDSNVAALTMPLKTKMCCLPINLMLRRMVNGIIPANELVFMNFYADWCRFSQILGPIFDEAADKIAEEFPPGKVLFGKIDAVSETNLAQRFKISKYPTLKLIRNGKILKREYRGQRSLDAIVQHVQDLMKDPVKDLENKDDIENVDTNKRKTVIYISDKNSPIYEVFLKVAMDLRDDCQFFIIKGPMAESTIPAGQKAKIIFNPSKSKIGQNDDEYIGALLSYDELSAWTTNRCIPLVREITFENAEELTEEGLPFLILFHNPDDVESPKMFTHAVQTQLLDDRTLVNFLIADGQKFAHPLHHLGKSQSDLPLVAIDSFRHMYLFPHFDDIHKPGKLKEFVLDLYSGKLHREFHYGPEPVTNENAISTNPPESTFKKLAPSRNRYTLVRDEL